MPRIAINPQTGERVALVDGQWVPITRTANNPTTGESVGFVGDQWVPIPSAKPAAPAPTPTTQAPEEGSGFLRQVADVPLQFGKGATTGVRMIADVFGADNAASKALTGVEDYLGDLMSAQSKNDSKRIADIMKEAEDKGLGAQVVAGLKALTIAPVDLVSNALGTSAPVIIGGVLAALSSPVSAPLAATAGAVTSIALGAATGAGAVKGSIYSTVKDELINAGVPKDKADAAAEQAQAYGGKNLDQILLGTVLGGVAGVSGVESALIKGLASKITSKIAAKEAAEMVAEEVPKGRIKSAARSAGAEAITEAPQEGQEQLAQNLALQRAGIDTPTFRGVASAATLGAGLGALTGGLAGGVSGGEKAAPEVEDTEIPGKAAPIPEGIIGSKAFNAKVLTYQNAGMSPEDAFNRAVVELQEGTTDAGPKQPDSGEAGGLGNVGSKPSVPPAGGENVDTGAAPAVTEPTGTRVGIPSGPAEPLGDGAVSEPGALNLPAYAAPGIKGTERTLAAKAAIQEVIGSYPGFQGKTFTENQLSKAAILLSQAGAKVADLAKDGFSSDILTQWGPALDPITTLNSVLDGTKPKTVKAAPVVEPTPAPAAIEPAPAPAAIEPTPVPAAIEPTPAPAAIEPTPVPAAIEPTPVPAAPVVEPPVDEPTDTTPPPASVAGAPQGLPPLPVAPNKPIAPQVNVAKKLADEISGDVAYQNGSFGLVRAYSAAGNPLYYTFDKGKLSKTHIADPAFSQGNLSFAQMDELTKAKAAIEAHDTARQAAEGPSIEYNADGVSFSDSVPNDEKNPIRSITAGWKNMFLPGAKIYVVAAEDLNEDTEGKFTGRYRAINALKAEDSYGTMRSLGNNEYAVMLKTKVASTAKRLETLAHELGHIHQRYAYDNATPEVKAAIRAEYDKWHAKNKNAPASEVVRNLRARKGAKYAVNAFGPTGLKEKFTTRKDKEYYLGFSEWYADQVSRWATTDAKPLTVVEKFFADLGKAMRAFYQTLKAQGYLPNETFAKYMESVSAKVDLTPTEEPAAAPEPVAPPANLPVVAAPAPAPKKAGKTFTAEEQAEYDKLLEDATAALTNKSISADHFRTLRLASTASKNRKPVAELRKMLADLEDEHSTKDAGRLKYEEVPSIIQEARVAAKKKVAKTTKLNRAIAASHTASDMNDGVGKLWSEVRGFSDALLLLKSTFDSLSPASIKKILLTLTTDDITRWIGDRIPAVKEVNGYIKDMTAMRSEMLRSLAQKMPDLTEFIKKFKAGGALLADVMHNATLIGFDPSAFKSLAAALGGDKELVEMRKNNARQSEINRRSGEVTELWNRWVKLGTIDEGTGHALYTMVKNEYQKTFDLHQKLLEEKIKVMDLSDPAKTKLWSQITKNFQASNQIGVYFPLMRYGNYWLRVGKGPNSEYYMFESAVSRNYAMAKRKQELKAAGETKELVRGDNLQGMRSEIVESSKMLKDILSELDGANLTDPNAVNALKDSVYQMYLMTLPDRDIRTRFAKRKGRIGFGADIARNFVVSQHTAANQLSRLKYADKIRNALSGAQENVAGKPDGLKLSAFINEISLRADMELTPPETDGYNWDKIASLGNKAVFYYMLTAPKSAIVQMTQLPIVGLPYLASKYGLAATLKMAGRYGNLFKTMGIEGAVIGADGKPKLDSAGNPIMKWGQPSIEKSDYIANHKDPVIKAALKAAWNYASDQDIFMSTYASDMTARAKQSTASYEGSVSKATKFMAGIMSGSFHHMERITREIMYMSAFELEYNKLQAAVKAGKMTAGDAQTKAQDAAIDAVYDSLFNYTQYNKPRIMKMNPITKIASQFMTFPLQMTSFLIRNFYSMLPYLNKAGKREAAVKFFGTVGMTYMFAGVVGLPGYSMIMGLAQGMRDALRPPEGDDWDEDDDGNPLGKRDLKLWFTETFIPEYFGAGSSLAEAMGLSEEQAQLLQRMVKMGPVSAISGLDIGSSTSLDGLFFRDDEKAENSKEAFEQFLLSHAFGPLGSMGSQMFSAYDDFEKGQFNRGVEKMLPAFFRGGAKALRFASEGNLTPLGAEVKNAEWYTTGRLLGQTAGFGSTEVTEIQKANFLAKKIVGDIELARTKLLQRLDLMSQRVDNNPTDANEAALLEVYDMIDKYNARNGILPITTDTVYESLTGKAENRAMALSGLTVSPQFYPYVADIITKSRSAE